MMRFVTPFAEARAVEFFGFPKGDLFFFGQLREVGAFCGTTVVKPFGTVITLNKKQMASVVRAVSMGVARFSTLVAMRDNIRRNPFAEPLIKNEIDADEFVVQTLFAYLSGVLNDAAVELKNMAKTLVFEPRTRFFAPNTARAIHDDFPIFMPPQYFADHLEFIAESFRGRTNGVCEETNFRFVVIAHIDDDGLRFGTEFIEGGSMEMRS